MKGKRQQGNNIFHIMKRGGGDALCGKELVYVSTPRAALSQAKNPAFFGEDRAKDWACCIDCARVASGLVDG